jgi:hypothetical protein
VRRPGVVAVGVAAGLAVALPAALLAQVADAVTDGDVSTAVTAPLVLLVLAGAAAAGSVTGDRASVRGELGRGPVVLGGTAGFLVIGLVQAIGVTRRLVADEDVAWETVPVVLVVGVALAATAAVIAARRPRRRPAGRTRA